MSIKPAQRFLEFCCVFWSLFFTIINYYGTERCNFKLCEESCTMDVVKCLPKLADYIYSSV